MSDLTGKQGYYVTRWLDEFLCNREEFTGYYDHMHRICRILDEAGDLAPDLAIFINNLVNDIPLSPLTGEDSEWIALPDDPNTFQNRRRSSVFKTLKDGEWVAFDARAKMFLTPYGSEYRSGFEGSWEVITFPYTPSEYLVLDTEIDEEVPQ